MNEKEEMDEYIKDLEETIRLLKNKENIEPWVVNDFLTNLNIEFGRNEIKKSKEEPPDVIFRDANFEIKTIHDEDRKMLKEYKDDLERAKKATNFKDAVNFRHYTPVDISIQEIVNLIDKKLRDYILSPEQYQKIDMLFYFNKHFYGITDSLEYTFPNKEIWERWRSVSMVKNGGINFIFWARDNAPNFIKINTGKIVFENKLLL